MGHAPRGLPEPPAQLAAAEPLLLLTAHMPQYLIVGSSLGEPPAMSQQQHAGLLQQQLTLQLLGQQEGLWEWCLDQKIEVVQA